MPGGLSVSDFSVSDLPKAKPGAKFDPAEEREKKRGLLALLLTGLLIGTIAVGITLLAVHRITADDLRTFY